MTDLAISLLHPPEQRGAEAWPAIDETAFADLGCSRILEAMMLDPKRAAAVTAPGSVLCQEVGAIEYRLDVLEDLLANEALVRCVEALLPRIERLRFYVTHPGKTDATPLQ